MKFCIHLFISCLHCCIKLIRTVSIRALWSIGIDKQYQYQHQHCLNPHVTIPTHTCNIITNFTKTTKLKSSAFNFWYKTIKTLLPFWSLYRNLSRERFTAILTSSSRPVELEQRRGVFWLLVCFCEAVPGFDMMHCKK